METLIGYLCSSLDHGYMETLTGYLCSSLDHGYMETLTGYLCPSLDHGYMETFAVCRQSLQCMDFEKCVAWKPSFNIYENIH